MKDLDKAYLEGIDFKSDADRCYHTPYLFEVEGGILLDPALWDVTYRFVGATSDYDQAKTKNVQELNTEVLVLANELQTLLAMHYKRPCHTIRNAEFYFNTEKSLIVEFESDAIRALKLNPYAEQSPNVDLNDPMQNIVVKIYSRTLIKGKQTKRAVCDYGGISLHQENLDENYKPDAIGFIYILKGILRVLRLKINMDKDKEARKKAIQRAIEVL